MIKAGYKIWVSNKVYLKHRRNLGKTRDEEKAVYGVS